MQFFFLLVVVCKAVRGQNVIISSRARHSMELRSPHDIINFAALLGLREADAKVLKTRSFFPSIPLDVIKF